MKMERVMPTHVALIMDGNGRWAQERGQERIYGHINGVERVRDAVKAALRNGVRYLTFYAFSTENWGRPQEEVEGLMELFCKCVKAEAPELSKQGVRVKIIGDKERLSEQVRSHFDDIEQKTAVGENLTMMLAVNYSSKDEIIRAIKKIAQSVVNNEVDINSIDNDMISSYLDTAGIPDPDLIIRTSGESRLSNFMLWQGAYAELYFTPTLWPDFDEGCFDQAMEAYCQRDRRYGLIKK